jgi:nucleotide-binding universal stress UspA family protein
MKILIGIDANDRYRPALRLFARLKFPVTEVVLAHCMEHPEPDSTELQHANDMLAKAKLEVTALASQTSARVLTVCPSDSLIQLATDTNCDLIAVQSERKGAFRSFFFGSVSRGLAIASPRPVLVSKGEQTSTDPVRIVFASDHSSYADAALDQFVKFAPRGIASVQLVSAVSMIDYVFWATHFDPYRSSEEREGALRQKFELLNSIAVERLTVAGYVATSTAPLASVGDAISDAMRSADLLVMGAQGHGFVERLLIGSNSLQQVIIEPHSVLLLRPEMGRA